MQSTHRQICSKEEEEKEKEKMTGILDMSRVSLSISRMISNLIKTFSDSFHMI
jgi:hypothetical protein